MTRAATFSAEGGPPPRCRSELFCRPPVSPRCLLRVSRMPWLRGEIGQGQIHRLHQTREAPTW